MAGLRADELFTCLDRHGVQYVLIGGLAAVLHGSPLPTLDADICPARTPENLVRLAAALREIDARLRTSDTPAGVRFPHAFELSAADAMVPDQPFAGPFDITARLSRSGDAFPAPGDLEGTTAGVAEGASSVSVVIAKVRQ